jgi:hypothetical protein
MVMAKALAAVRVALAESARRTRRAKLALPPASVARSLGPSATKAQIGEALLAIDILPRTVVVLCLLEGIRTADAAIALDVDSAHVRKALAIGVRELVTNLAQGNDSAAPLLASTRPEARSSMKGVLLIAIAVAATHDAAAAADRQELSEGLRYYEEAELGKAAAWFADACDTGRTPEACYWAGLSYERLADTRIPFGCSTAAKGHRFFLMAVNFAPDRPANREALFNFLLDNADCSRIGLRDAAGLLSGMAVSDPEYDRMRGRLEEAMNYNTRFAVRLSRVFLLLPRAAVHATALPGTALTKVRADRSSPRNRANRRTAPVPRLLPEAA